MYSEEDYNPISYEAAVKADSVTAYLASKRFAEKAAFDFVANNKPHFDILFVYNDLKSKFFYYL